MCACSRRSQVVYKRILDEVPMHIREYLLHEFADKERLPGVIYQSTLEELKQAGTGKARARASSKMGSPPGHPDWV